MEYFSDAYPSATQTLYVRFMKNWGGDIIVETEVEMMRTSETLEFSDVAAEDMPTPPPAYYFVADIDFDAIGLDPNNRDLFLGLWAGFALSPDDFEYDGLSVWHELYACYHEERREDDRDVDYMIRRSLEKVYLYASADSEFSRLAQSDITSCEQEYNRRDDEIGGSNVDFRCIDPGRNDRFDLAPVLEVSFMSTEDPWERMSDLTDCSGDFGLSAEELMAISIVLFVFGAIILIPVIILFCCASRSLQAHRQAMEAYKQQYPYVPPPPMQMIQAPPPMMQVQGPPPPMMQAQVEMQQPPQMMGGQPLPPPPPPYAQPGPPQPPYAASTAMPVRRGDVNIRARNNCALM